MSVRRSRLRACGQNEGLKGGGPVAVPGQLRTGPWGRGTTEPGQVHRHGAPSHPAFPVSPLQFRPSGSCLPAPLRCAVTPSGPGFRPSVHTLSACSPNSRAQRKATVLSGAVCQLVHAPCPCHSPAAEPQKLLCLGAGTQWNTGSEPTLPGVGGGQGIGVCIKAPWSFQPFPENGLWTHIVIAIE